jgi:RNA polymerase sigma factor (sigma-70 family)
MAPPASGYGGVGGRRPLFYAGTRNHRQAVAGVRGTCSQVRRVKVWRALVAYDPEKSTAGQRSFVFSCVRNQAKDLVKRARRDWTYIEDVAPSINGNGHLRDQFESRYLVEEAEQVYGAIEDDLPLIPNTLTAQEREIIALLYIDFDYGEIATALDLERKKVATAVRGIREKLADWRPNATPEKSSVPLAA